MTLVKFSQKPWENSFSSLFEDIFQQLPASGQKEKGFNLNKGFAPVNITENNDGYQIEVIAPGMEKGDFKINVDQNILTISGEKKSSTKDENEKEIRKEFSYKSFSRSFTLDDVINAEEIAAKYENGVLQLSLPKKEEVKVSPKEISIQ